MKERFRIDVRSEEGTLKFGKLLAGCLAGRGSVHVRGSLGAGKTTLCRGILRAMGHQGAVKSPTFTLVEPYETERYKVFHFDLYRLGVADELDYMGVDEYFGEESLCLVEWPERACGRLPEHDLVILLEGSGMERRISLESNRSHGETVCRELTEIFGSRTASG